MTTNNSIETKIQNLLGKSYGWDAELNELQYRGDPVSFWITDHEAAAEARGLERLLPAEKQKEWRYAGHKKARNVFSPTVGIWEQTVNSRNEETGKPNLRPNKFTK
jgi:hypothetical protein